MNQVRVPAMSKAIKSATNVLVLGARLYKELAVSALSMIPSHR